MIPMIGNFRIPYQATKTTKTEEQSKQVEIRAVVENRKLRVVTCTTNVQLFYDA